jgi:hypothetical protein
MKTRNIMASGAMPALLIVAAGLLGGCESAPPVGEYSAQSYYYERTPSTTRVRTVRRIEPVGEYSRTRVRTIRRYRSDLEPIGERAYVAPRQEFVAPYGPNLPPTPSQWW